MGQIIKFPGQAAKFGFKRVRKRAPTEHPGQLDLFPQRTAQILDLSLGLRPFEQALLWDERGEAKAAELYVKAIEEGDRVADAFCNLGIIESQKGNTARAFDCFTNALKHDPRHSEAHFNLGNLYFDVNDFRLAQIHYEMVVEVDPAFANVYFNLALTQAINNELAAAVGTLGRYQEMVSEEEGRKADELLHNLQKTLAARARLGSTD
ncbi:MAG: tetratricopeptide repeat protein [Verrucomicrobiota bacterium]